MCVQVGCRQYVATDDLVVLCVYAYMCVCWCVRVCSSVSSKAMRVGCSRYVVTDDFGLFYFCAYVCVCVCLCVRELVVDDTSSRMIWVCSVFVLICACVGVCVCALAFLNQGYASWF